MLPTILLVSLSVCVSGLVRPTLCTTLWVQDCVVHHRPALFCLSSLIACWSLCEACQMSNEVISYQFFIIICNRSSYYKKVADPSLSKVHSQLDPEILVSSWSKLGQLTMHFFDQPTAYSIQGHRSCMRSHANHTQSYVSDIHVDATHTLRFVSPWSIALILV